MARLPEALMRDRFWKLLDERHDKLRTAGVAIWGIKGVDEHVPPLQSRSVAAKPKKQEPPGTPATPATPPK